MSSNFGIIDYYNSNYSEDEIKSRFKYCLCSICSKVLVDSYQILCGCRMCKACIDKYLNDGSIGCPRSNLSKDCEDITLLTIDDCKKDYKCDEDILNVTVQCCTNGCEFEDKLINMTDHLEQCNGVSVDFDDNDEPDLSIVIHDLEEEVEKCCELIKSNEKKFHKKLKEKEQEIEFLKEKFVETQINMKNLEIQLRKNYLWKIADFSLKKDEVKLVSNEFYFEKYGHCLQMELYPNGVNRSGRDYLSLFVVLVNGLWDDVVEWPFKYDITFVLIAPNSRDNYEVSIKYWEENDAYHKPDVKNTNNLGEEKLIAKSIIESTYLINDSIYIECYVTPAD